MPKRILIAGLKHETHTFSRLPTDLTSDRDRILYRRAEVPARLVGTRSEVAAFLDAAARHGWQVVTPVVADATPSGKVTEETYRVIAGEILAAAANEGPFDGVLLNLHGAMVAEHTDDGEGTLLAALREVLGPDVPIAATLDLHANVTERMAECADILVSYRTYPHIDQYDVAAEAAALLARTLAGEIRPRIPRWRGAACSTALITAAPAPPGRCSRCWPRPRGFRLRIRASSRSASMPVFRRPTSAIAGLRW